MLNVTFREASHKTPKQMHKTTHKNHAYLIFPPSTKKRESKHVSTHTEYLRKED